MLARQNLIGIVHTIAVRVKHVTLTRFAPQIMGRDAGKRFPWLHRVVTANVVPLHRDVQDHIPLPSVEAFDRLEESVQIELICGLAANDELALMTRD